MPRRPLPSSTDPSPPADRASRPPIDEVRGAYRVRYARDAEDLRACLRLRYEVFNVELGEGLRESEETGLDRDCYDDVCDHLMVIEEASGGVVGTYRLQTEEMAREGHGLYSASEYDLSSFPEEVLSGAVELGRACVLESHRNKIVLFLLWRGLMAYLLWNDKRFLFGCSSLTSTDPGEGLAAFEWLERAGHVQEGFLATPLPTHVCPEGEPHSYEGDFPIPRLFSTYLRHGAKVCSPPAIDRLFGTIDFLTLLDVEDFDPRLAAIFAFGLARR